MFHKKENSKPLTAGTKTVLIVSVALISSFFIWGGVKIFSGRDAQTASQTAPDKNIFAGATANSDRYSLEKSRTGMPSSADSITLLQKANEKFSEEIGSTKKTSADFSARSGKTAGAASSSEISGEFPGSSAPNGKSQETPDAAQGSGGWNSSQDRKTAAAGNGSSAAQNSSVSTIKSSAIQQTKGAPGKSRAAFSNNRFSSSSSFGKKLGAGKNFSSDISGESAGNFSGGNGAQGFAGGAAAAGISSYGSQGSSGEGSSQSSSSDGSSAGGQQSTAQQTQQEKPKPEIYIWKQSVDFGKLGVYETLRRPFMVMNIGALNLNLGKIISLDEDAPFYVERDGCSKKTLKPRESCVFYVRFTPNTYKDFSSGFRIENNTPGMAPYQNYLDVRGKGVYSQEHAFHFLIRSQLASTRMDFGYSPAGTYNELKYILKNDSGKVWKGLYFRRTGNASFYLCQENCPENLEPGHFCFLTVRFLPQDTFNKGLSANYGRYNAVHGYSGQKEILTRPEFPPYVIDKAVEVNAAGLLTVYAKTLGILTNRPVNYISLIGTSSAKYPVYGLKRFGRYVSFPGKY